MLINNNNYLCFVDGSRQQIAYDKSLSSFSLLDSFRKAFFMQNPDHKPGLLSNIYRSVSKIFDCVGLTKPRLTSKLHNFCYLRFYAAILSNVAELTTLRKQSHKVRITVPEMAINLQNKPCQSALFLLSLSRETTKKMKQIFAFLGFPLFKREV